MVPSRVSALVVVRVVMLVAMRASYATWLCASSRQWAPESKRGQGTHG